MNAPNTPVFVLLSIEAKERGFKSTLAFSRWCKRNSVAIHKTQKMCWVNRPDVDAAIARANKPSNDNAHSEAADIQELRVELSKLIAKRR